MSNDLSAILQAVADGTLSPEEATARIEARPAPSADDATPAAPIEPVRRLVIRGGALRLIVVGDPEVAEAVADGPHRTERDGDALVISSNVTEGGYSTEPPRSAFMSWLSQVMDRVGATLTIRVNPELPLQVLMVGGSLDITGIRAAVSVGVEAGSARLAEGAGPVNLEVTSGSARVDWTFTGESAVRADMGSAFVLVRADSDVAVTAEATLGQGLVKAHDGIRTSKSDQSTSPVIVGAGAGTLHAVARMGSVQVTIA